MRAWLANCCSVMVYVLMGKYKDFPGPVTKITYHPSELIYI
jgi:hypothetical protein